MILDYFLCVSPWLGLKTTLNYAVFPPHMAVWVPISPDQ